MLVNHPKDSVWIVEHHDMTVKTLKATLTPPTHKRRINDKKDNPTTSPFPIMTVFSKHRFMDVGFLYAFINFGTLYC